MMDTIACDHVESRATPATRASSLMEILKSRRKQKDVLVPTVALANVGSRATPAINPMEMLKAGHKWDLDTPVLPAGVPQEVLKVTTDQGLPPGQHDTVDVLNNVADTESTSPGLPVRLCLGCDKPFTPSDENKAYCSARCWNTPRAVIMLSC